MSVVVADVLRTHPEVAFFLVIGLGYLLGKVSIAGFSLGAVTGTLLAGVLVGQLGVTVSGDVKQCFFMLFLFSIGYRCGPQFFRGLRSDGLAQAALAVIVVTTGLLVAYVVSKLVGYDAGTAAGVIAGALTESATIGTAGEAIGHLPTSPDQRAAMINAIPVAFAVTYLIGVVGAAWFLAQIAPRLMGVDLAQACREYEEKMGSSAPTTGLISAYRMFELRAFRITADGPLLGRNAMEIASDQRIFVERIRRGDAIIEPDIRTILQENDIVAISGPRQALVDLITPDQPEVEDQELLDVPSESLDVFVAGDGVHGRTLRELSTDRLARGIFLRRIVRNGVAVPRLPDTTIERGDVVTITGRQNAVEAAVGRIGYADRPRDTTDMVFVASGIVAGALIGLPSILLGSIEIGLSSSVGVLLGGLVWGCARSVRPVFGRIPVATLWLFESLGLAGFVAVVGLAAGPDFVRGLRESGLSLIIAGLLTVLLPHLVGVLIGRFVFRMHPGIVLGVCAGAGTATPALAAVQEAAQSPVPTLGYGISYAVGNVLLALWGTVIVAMIG